MTSGMEEEPSIFDVEDERRAREAEAQADADIAAGRTVPHGDVRAWLESLGSDNPLPTPYSWRK